MTLSAAEITVDDDALDSEIEVSFVPHGRIVAKDLTVDEFMTRYMDGFYEYVEGYVIQMSPNRIEHIDLLGYLIVLVSTYFELRPIGRVISQPFVMRLPAFPKRRREPDAMIILNSNPGRIECTYMNGAPDLVIEIISEESFVRDNGEKFIEYQNGGVGEYWLLDRLRQDARFYRPNADKIYVPQPITDGIYQTPILPGLKLHVPTLWQEQLPGPIAVGNAVCAMLAPNEST